MAFKKASDGKTEPTTELTPDVLKEEVQQTETSEVGSELTSEETDAELLKELVTDPEENVREYYFNQAHILGLKVPTSVSTDRLIQLVGAKLKEGKGNAAAQSAAAADQFMNQRALVRIRINVLNPAKQNWTGEIFTVGNDYIPHMTRFVPFNTPDGIWHVERIFVDMLKNRKYTYIPEKSGDKFDPRNYGADLNKRQLRPEFSIEILPPLTSNEIYALAAKQDATGSIQTDETE